MTYPTVYGRAELTGMCDVEYFVDEHISGCVMYNNTPPATPDVMCIATQWRRSPP